MSLFCHFILVTGLRYDCTGNNRRTKIKEGFVEIFFDSGFGVKSVSALERGNVCVMCECEVPTVIKCIEYLMN